MSQIIRDLHNKYILDFDPSKNDMVVYEYCPATFSKSEGEWKYAQCGTHSFSAYTGGSTHSAISGSWYDTTSQYSTVGTASLMKCDSISYENGISYSNGRFYVSQAGRYNFQFSAQIDQSSGSGEHIYIWFRKNGIDEPWSASEIAIQGTTAETIPAWNYIFEMNAGDYASVAWSITSANVHLKAVAPAGIVPGIPSVIATMIKI